MRFSLLARYSRRGVTDISPELFLRDGIFLVMLDVDNTLMPYGKERPSEAVADWVRSLTAHGLTPYIVSNSHRNE
ncbi:MAG: YqeG family HAD IIIA-type phosphatase, partial [Oscillospiraceae bacterium]|nr:YqeG family HAD IIIA-type phosphatase [Oscillospiraceae bacterium]